MKTNKTANNEQHKHNRKTKQKQKHTIGYKEKAVEKNKDSVNANSQWFLVQYNLLLF
jgi:hypothetical protein